MIVMCGYMAVPENGHTCYYYCLYLQYLDDVANTIEENTSVVSLTQIRYLSSARTCWQ